MLTTKTQPEDTALDVDEAPVCLRVTFVLQVPAEQYLADCRRIAAGFHAIDGLHFKLWLLDPEVGTGGGVYLFRDRSAAEAYLDSAPMVALRRSSTVAGFRVEVTPVSRELSRLSNPELRL